MFKIRIKASHEGVCGEGRPRPTHCICLEGRNRGKGHPLQTQSSQGQEGHPPTPSMSAPFRSHSLLQAGRRDGGQPGDPRQKKGAVAKEPLLQASGFLFKLSPIHHPPAWAAIPEPRLLPGDSCLLAFYARHNIFFFLCLLLHLFPG